MNIVCHAVSIARIYHYNRRKHESREPHKLCNRPGGKINFPFGIAKLNHIASCKVNVLFGKTVNSATTYITSCACVCVMCVCVEYLIALKSIRFGSQMRQTNRPQKKLNANQKRIAIYIWNAVNLRFSHKMNDGSGIQLKLFRFEMCDFDGNVTCGRMEVIHFYNSVYFSTI